jgi:lipoyl(octanoyl) transferase
MTANLPDTIELRQESAPVPYREALDAMSERNAAISAGQAGELIWLLEHPPLGDDARLFGQPVP